MRHETNFFDGALPPKPPRLGEVPPYLNGKWSDDPGNIASLEFSASDGPLDDGDIIHEALRDDLKAGTALWVLNEAWDSSQIPRRPWIARGYLMRGAVTVVSGAGAAGKSSLMVGWATVMAIGCALHRLKTAEPMRIATYNVEDDQDEQKRRFSAMLMRLGVTHTELGNRLAILGPKQVGTLLVPGKDGGLVLNTAAMDELEAFVAEFLPDVLMLDPFVELHGAEENDNTAIRAVMARFRAMAVRYRMAVVLLHHSRKGAGDPGDPESLRGASSIVGAARVVLTVTVMTDEEAKAFGIPSERRRNYFRLDGAKSNYAPIDEAEWFERQEMTLDNGDEDTHGDGAVVAWPWTPPSVWANTTPAMLNAVLDRIDAGHEPGIPFSGSKKGGSARWAGQVLMNEIGMSEEHAARIMKQWLDNKLLLPVEFHDPKSRRSAIGVRVDHAKRPTT